MTTSTITLIRQGIPLELPVMTAEEVERMTIRALRFEAQSRFNSSPVWRRGL